MSSGAQLTVHEQIIGYKQMASVLLKLPKSLVHAVYVMSSKGNEIFQCEALTIYQNISADSLIK